MTAQISARAGALSREYDQLFGEVVEFCQRSSESDWQAATTEEGWPVKVVAHHIAVGTRKIVEWTKIVCNGGETGDTHDDIDEWNAREAANDAAYTKQATLALLNDTAAEARELLGSLTDEQLNQTGVFSARGTPITGERMAGALVGHMRTHFSHMQTAIEGKRPASPAS
jgi:hypothetical protein